MKKITTYISIILILVVGVGLFFMQDIVNYLTRESTTTSELNLTKDDLYSELISNNLDIKLSQKDFLEGFWYDGPNGLIYFDIEAFLKFGYSMEEIREMIKRIKKEKIYKKNNMEILSEDELDDDIKFSNAIYDSSPLLKNNYKKIKKSLESKNPKKAIDYFRLSEIYSLEGEYGKSQKNLNSACRKDKKYCQKNKVKVSGKVVDLNGKGIPSVKITFLSVNKRVLSNEKGEYSFDLDLVKLKKERLSFEKNGYSTAFISFSNNSDFQKKISRLNVEMTESDNIYILNSKTGEVKGSLVEFKDNKFILKTKLSTYYIPKDAFVDKKNKKYLGVIRASLFEFNESNVPKNLLELDSFSKDRNFLGTSMKTYGMPYIIFTKENGEEIYVKSSKPMILETKMGYLSVLFNSEHLSDDKKKEILSKSKKGKFYYDIDRINKEYTQMIPYWVLDQRNGVWENAGYDLIDAESGKIKVKFYTTK